MIANSDAIVLKSIKYGDTSKIVTLYTKNYGKISVIAKGARKPKNKFGSSLNPLSYINVNFYYKVNRDLQVLNNSDILEHFAMLDANYESLIATLILAEFVNNISQTNEVNEEIFELLLYTLRVINHNIKKAYNIIIKALINLSAITGFATSFNFNFDNIENIVFSLEDGKPTMTLPKNNIYYNLDKLSLKILNQLQQSTKEDIVELQISKDTFIDCIYFFQKYFNFHLGKNFKLKTINLLQQL